LDVTSKNSGRGHEANFRPDIRHPETWDQGHRQVVRLQRHLPGPQPEEHVEQQQGAATALRIAATSLRRSKTYMGAMFRRLRARLGASKANTAMARMLARVVSATGNPQH